MEIGTHHSTIPQGSLTRRTAVLGAATLPLAGGVSTVGGCFAGPDAALLDACARHLTLFVQVRRTSSNGEDDELIRAVEDWSRVYREEIVPATPRTETGATAKRDAWYLQNPYGEYPGDLPADRVAA